MNTSFDHAQVVRVPEFSSVRLAAACTLSPGSGSLNTAHRWDGASGGIVAFFADDSGAMLPTSIDGTISADGAGFQRVPTQGDNASTSCGSLDNLTITVGGSLRGERVTSVSYGADIGSGVGNVANGGGGGNCRQSGGGGGSNAGLGGNGGPGSGLTLGGRGGAPVAWRNVNSATDALYPTQSVVTRGSLTTRLTFGGAGGHGQTRMSQGAPGGNGGGVIFIRANRLPGMGSIHANGVTPVTPVPDADGQGGGGGGGTIAIRLEGVLGVPCANIQVRGGNGGSTSTAGVGAGGGGSGGRTLVQSSNACATSVVTGGTGGTVAGGASGAAGASGSREAVPGASAYCPDASEASDTLCSSLNAATPRCDAAFNFCAECGSDAHCTNPNQPHCDVFNGVCAPAPVPALPGRSVWLLGILLSIAGAYGATRRARNG